MATIKQVAAGTQDKPKIKQPRKKREPKVLDELESYVLETTNFLERQQRFYARDEEEMSVIKNSPDVHLVHTEIYGIGYDGDEIPEEEYRKMEVYGLKRKDGYFPYYILGLDNYVYKVETFEEITKMIDAQRMIFEQDAEMIEQSRNMRNCR